MLQVSKAEKALHEFWKVYLFAINFYLNAFCKIKKVKAIYYITSDKVMHIILNYRIVLVLITLKSI